MPQIKFAKNNWPPLQVERGVNLMQALLDAGIPVASSCHGDGVCGKCRLEVKEGMSSLSGINEIEEFLKEKDGLKPTLRISCQVQVLGDVVLDASYW